MPLLRLFGAVAAVLLSSARSSPPCCLPCSPSAPPSGRLRGADPATLLIASFAVSFFLREDDDHASSARGRRASTSCRRSAGQVEIAGVRLQACRSSPSWSASSCWSATDLVPEVRRGSAWRCAPRPRISAWREVLGVRANRVIATAFAISGLLAAAVACLFVAQTGLVQPRMGLQLVVIAFVGTVIGGLGSLPGAALGGFLVGVATILLQALLPPDLRVFREAFLFVAVTMVLALPAAGTDPRARPEGAHMTARIADRRQPRWWPLVAPDRDRAGARGRGASFAPTVVQRRITQGLINLVAVVGLYVFVGNSGVLSFGNVAFMAVGAYVSALLTMPAAAKGVFLPDLPAFLAAAEWPAIAGALAGGAAAALGRARSRLAADAPLRHFGEHRDLRRARRHLCRARQLDLGHRRPELADGAADLCRPVDRRRLGGRGDRRRLHPSGDRARACCSGPPARTRSAAAASGVHMVSHRLIAFVISAFLSGIAGVLLGAFPRHGAGRDLLSRPHLPDRRHAGDRRHAQPDWRRRRRDRHRPAHRAYASGRGRRHCRRDDHRRSRRAWRRDAGAADASHHPLPPERHRRRPGNLLAVSDRPLKTPTPETQPRKPQ